MQVQSYSVIGVQHCVRESLHGRAVLQPNIMHQESPPGSGASGVFMEGRAPQDSSRRIEHLRLSSMIASSRVSNDLCAHRTDKQQA